MIGENRYIIIPYQLASSKNTFSVVEKRIIYRFLHSLQPLIKNRKLNQAYIVLFDDEQRTFNYNNRDFRRNIADNNYKEIRKSIQNLTEKKILIENSNKIISEYSIIQAYDYNINKEHVITLTKGFVNLFLNFSRGFRKVELDTIFNLRRATSMKFYELLAKSINFNESNTIKNNHPIKYSIAKLRWILNCEDNYKGRNGDFINHVVMSAKKELDQHSPISFSYTPYHIINKINGLKIKIEKLEENFDPILLEKELKNNLSPRNILPSEFIKILKKEFDFNNNEIKNNMDLLEKWREDENFIKTLEEVQHMIFTYENIENKKGFLIAHLKKRLNKP